MLQKNKNLLIAIIISIFLISGAFFMVNVPLSPKYSTVSSLNVVIFGLPSFWALFRWIGIKSAILIITSLGVYALVIESIGLLTGFPYGEFSYSEILGFRLFGVVPWTVAFAWSPLVLSVLAVTRKTIKSAWLRGLAMTLLLVLIDMVLDPGAVYLGFWKYSSGGSFYQVPLTNFAGWIFSGAIGAGITEILLFYIKPISPVPVQLTTSSFFLLVFWTAIAIWAGLIIPALLGLILLSALSLFYHRFYYAFDTTRRLAKVLRHFENKEKLSNN